MQIYIKPNKALRYFEPLKIKNEGRRTRWRDDRKPISFHAFVRPWVTIIDPAVFMLLSVRQLQSRSISSYASVLPSVAITYQSVLILL